MIFNYYHHNLFIVLLFKINMVNKKPSRMGQERTLLIIAGSVLGGIIGALVNPHILIIGVFTFLGGYGMNLLIHEIRKS